DSALVSAAQLSHRYITDRFLPDKAIDLVDEAASRIAMERESVPQEIDEVQRRLQQLELAARQLQGETEDTAQDRLAEIEDEIDEQKQKLASLREQWEAEKLGAGDVKALRQDLDAADRDFAKFEAEIREKQSSGQLVQEADYQKLYELDQQRKQLRKRIETQEEKDGDTAEAKPSERRLLRTEVTEDEIAAVVSAWTGIPVNRMLETERAKLLVME